MSGKTRSSRAGKQTEDVPESIKRGITWILAALVSIGTIMILAVMPFYFRKGYTHIGTDKSYFFRTGSVKLGMLILPVSAAWIICCIVIAFLHRQKALLKEWTGKLCSTDFFVFFYGVSVILSYLCSNYKETALWGTKGWFMGLVPQLTLVMLYFLISRFQIGAKWLLVLGMSASVPVFALGYLNRFDVWPLAMEKSGLPNYISTIGNINWYCAYVVAVFFVGVGLLWLDRGEKLWITLLLCGYVFTGFATLITQGSDSGIFALAVVLLALFIMSAKDGDALRIERFWLIILLLGASGLVTMEIRFLAPERINLTSGFGNLMTYSPLPVILFLAAAGILLAGKYGRLPLKILLRGMRLLAKISCIGIPAILALLAAMIALNTVRPGSLGPLSDIGVFNFNNRWGSSRGATWSVGVRCFAGQDILHKLTGVGPDCMADFLYSGSDGPLLETVQRAFENRRLTNAHCELLTILVNMGLIGMISYAGVFIGIIKRFLSGREQSVYAAACGLCALAYFANGLWSFQQSMGVAAIFVIMGLGESFLRGLRN